jgi:hypothetical protein
MSSRALPQYKAAILCAALLLAPMRPACAGEPRLSDPREAYHRQIVAVAEGWKSVVQLKSLRSDPAFEALASMASSHINDCVDFLANGNHSLFERDFAILSMYKLQLDDYIAFLREMLGLYHRGQISINELIEAAAPPTTLVPSVTFDNYDNPQVHALLKYIAAQPGVDDLNKSYLAFVMEGGGFWYRTDRRIHAVFEFGGIN